MAIAGFSSFSSAQISRKAATIPCYPSLTEEERLSVVAETFFWIPAEAMRRFLEDCGLCK